MSSKRIGHVWFTGRQSIGVVLCRDLTTGEFKSWIGVGKGYSSEDDMKEIQEWGTKFDPDTAVMLISRHGVYDVPHSEWENLLKERENKGSSEDD